MILRSFFPGLMLAVTVIAASPSAHGQTPAADSGEKWWPHPLWGEGDQAGGSNWIKPEKVLEAMRLVSHGKIYELGQVYTPSMPLYGTRSYSMLTPSWDSREGAGVNRLVGHEEFLCTQIGQVGTQFDGPGHIGREIRRADGVSEYRFYNGFTEEQIQGSGGLRQLGIEHVRPIVTRGILLDVAGAKGVAVLEPAYEITLADIRETLSRQGWNESDIRPGDAIFFRYGWSRYWKDAQRYNSNPPGIGLEVARWVVARQASMVGSDSWTTEVVPNPNPELVFPVHQELIMKNGVFNLENMVFESLAEEGVREFLFIMTPIPFQGASGSPARPIAIR